MAKKAKIGDTVQVSYVGTLENGDVFDSSKDDPLEFVIGCGKLIRGFDDAVVGMEIGKEKEIVIQPSQAYGPYQDELVQDVPIRFFEEKKIDTKKGTMLTFKAPDGHMLIGRITEANGKSVKIDLNHPLAGKVLKFRIKLLGIG